MYGGGCLNELWINLFMSKEFMLLCFLQNKQIATADGDRILHSQIDISKEFGISIATVNKLISGLIASGCLEKHKQKSGYRITPKGNYLIEQISKINEYNGGNSNGK